MMSDTENSRSKVKRWPRRIIALALISVLSLALFVLILVTTDAPLPAWLKNEVEARMDAAYVNGHVQLGAIRIAAISNGADPVVTLQDVVIKDNSGNIRARLPEIQAVFDGADMLGGNFNAISIELGRAAFNLVRDRDGRIDIAFADSEGERAVAEDRSIGDLLVAIKEGFAARHLARLERITSNGVNVTLRDELTGRRWIFRDGLLEMLVRDDDLFGELAFRLINENGNGADATFRLSIPEGDQGAKFETRFAGFEAVDLADQMPAFNWLRILDAPISGALTMEITSGGSFGTVNGVLDVGAGHLFQDETEKGTQFTGGKAYLRYDPDAQKFTFDQVLLDTEAARFVAEGNVYLSDKIDRIVGGIIGQLRFSKAEINPDGMFEAPLQIDLGILDFRARLDPLAVDIGQLVVFQGDEKIALKGALSLGDNGWSSRVEITSEQISRQSLVKAWPLNVVPKTRTWIDKNIHQAKLENIRGVLNVTPGGPPEITLGFDVNEAEFHFLKFLPPVEGGVGYGVLTTDSFDIVLEAGTLEAPKGGRVNIAGSRFSIPNLKVRPTPAFAELKTQSSVTALLSVIDLPPFSFLEKAGTNPDLADGTVAASGRIDFPLVDKVTFDLVDLSIEGKIQSVSTDRLVKNKMLRAPLLLAKVDNSGITISGEGTLGALDISGLWRQNFGPGDKGKSHFEGLIEISANFLKEFGIGLPDGSVTGKGVGNISVDLVRGRAPKFELVSDLNRIGMKLAALGWAKPAATRGNFRADGKFGSPPSIRKLSIQAAGLTVDGSVTLKKDGSLRLADFKTVKIAPWLETSATLQPGSGGQTLLTVNGGRADFRSAKFGSETSGEDGAGMKIDARLDRLVISSGIALTNFTGDILSKSGLSGAFAASVNGGAKIVGGLAPLKNGTAIRFTSDDAGSVMSSANVFTSGAGGRLDMTLVPRVARGEYDGTMKVTNIRVRNASALAGLLSAISVVGLLEQLGGEGIHFSNADAKFILTPDGVTLRESSAVGASLGLTMEGVYRFVDATLDMQGVVTPIYLLNGILEQSKIFGGLFGRKTGEGLFGFNYTLRGPVGDPKVGVNPLSILTPGMFREIFRQPAPKQTGTNE